MEEAEDIAGAGEAAPAVSFVIRDGPGILLCLAIAAVSWTIGKGEESVWDRQVIEALVIAMVAGVLVRAVIGLPEVAVPGSQLIAKQILEASVLLLGASVNVREILDAGPTLLGLVIGAVFLSLATTYVIGRLLRLHSNLATLVSVGNSICGNSAIAAVAKVIGASADDVATAIGLGAILGLIQILLLPVLVPALGLTHYQYGVIAGMAVYAVPQVIAAGFAVSVLSGQVATFVKLIRVLFIGPAAIVVGLVRGRAGREEHAPLFAQVQAYVPWFVAGFLVLAAGRSIGFISADLASDAKSISTLTFIVGMAGLGLGVDLTRARAVGPRVAATIFSSMILLTTIAIVGTFLLDLRG
jgi:uncharacterized integral membrane protein (TIGR00698 family)